VKSFICIYFTSFWGGSFCGRSSFAGAVELINNGNYSSNFFFWFLAANIRQRAAKTGHKISKPVERDVESGLERGMG